MEEVKAKFEEIKKLCKESVEEYGENSFYFKDGASESEIISWEKQTGIMIPETYREWLKLTKECMIRDNVASFFLRYFYFKTISLIILIHNMTNCNIIINLIPKSFH